VPCDGRAFGEIIDDLRGERGSSLEVTIRRNGDAEDRVYKMVREVIPISTVSGQQRNDDGTWVLELPGHADIAYVEITDIVGSTAAELIEMARKIEKQKFRAVILDFTRMSEHSVPDIHHAIMLADALLGEAQIGELYTRDNQTEIRTQPDHVLANTPLVIFTPRVASGPGFLVLAALANQGRAKLVGPRLTSRGLCTKSVELDGLGAINQLPYAVAVPRGKELSPTETASQFENHLSQLSECLTLIPDAIVEDASKMENYLKPALELLQQP
jgi:carboxyl-terminal processing protease